MQTKYIKESIKQKHSNNGNKSLRNNYAIYTTNKDRNRYAKRKFNLALRDSKKDLSITMDLQKTIIRKLQKLGYTRKQFYAMGSLKALQLLK